MEQRRTVSVIGGGPAGMMAAIAAARAGAAVRLWEKNGSLGRKLLATGNGRCNFTNRDLAGHHFHGGSRDVVDQALARFDGQRTLDFFRELGVECLSDERGRCFPASNEAGSLLFALEREMGHLSIEVSTRCEIVAISSSGNGFTVNQRGEKHSCDRVIIACGGAAAPQFGSNGGGFELARHLGHHVIPVRPALVPVELAGSWYHKLQGVRLDMALTITRRDGSTMAFTDEGLFTHYGLSGPLALRASREMGQDNSICVLDFVPGHDREQAARMLALRREHLGGEEAADLLTGWLPAKLGRMLVRESGIAAEMRISEVAADAVDTLVHYMKKFPITINSLRGLKEAQVTVGGADTGEIVPGTMGSTLVPGLFFCGEVVDVDGDSGGYNLQWCWSSGWVAGRHAAEG